MYADTEKLIELYDNYLEFLKVANNEQISIAVSHGYVCPYDIIKKGIEFRNKINELKKIVLDDIRQDKELFEQNIDRIAPEGDPNYVPDLLKNIFGMKR